MAELTIVDVARSGLKVARVAAASGGDRIQQVSADRGRLFLSIANVTSAARTLTIVTPGTQDGLAVADRTVTLSASSEYLVGPFLPTSVYVTTSGYVDFTYSDAGASVEVQAIRLPQS